MKVTAIRCEVVLVPRRRPYAGRVSASALGPASHSEHGIVIVETDVGIRGLGEVASAFKRRGRLLCRELETFLAPVVVGEDPFRIAHLVERMDAALDGAQPAKAALEMGLHDIVGKALDTPVHNLLGGRVRDRIPLSHSIPWGAPVEMAAFAAELVARGFRTVKVKVGQDPRRDVEAVRLVREAIGPEIRLRVDANMAWRSTKEAIALIHAMEPFAPELIEQPLPPGELDAMAEVRRRIAVPLMADESVWTPRDAMEVVRRGAADAVNVYVSEAGGLLAASRIFTVAAAAGLSCMIGSMPECGIGTAAQIHLALAMPNLDLDSDTCGVMYHEEDILARPLRFENGFAYPPEGPGLGVDLDFAMLERLRAPS